MKLNLQCSIRSMYHLCIIISSHILEHSLMQFMDNEGQLQRNIVDFSLGCFSVRLCKIIFENEIISLSKFFNHWVDTSFNMDIDWKILSFQEIKKFILKIIIKREHSLILIHISLEVFASWAFLFVFKVLRLPFISFYFILCFFSFQLRAFFNTFLHFWFVPQKYTPTIGFLFASCFFEVFKFDLLSSSFPFKFFLSSKSFFSFLLWDFTQIFLYSSQILKF